MNYLRFFLIALTLISTPLAAMNDQHLIDRVAQSCTDPLTFIEAMCIVSFEKNNFEGHFDHNVVAILTQGLQQANKSICDIVDTTGWTALHWAICTDHLKMVEYLLALPEAPGLVQVQENTYGETALHLAVYLQATAIITKLLDIFPVKQVYSTTKRGYTAWDYAISWWLNGYFPSQEVQDLLWPYLTHNDQQKISAEQEEHLQGYIGRTVGCSIQ